VLKLASADFAHDHHIWYSPNLAWGTQKANFFKVFILSRLGLRFVKVDRLLKRTSASLAQIQIDRSTRLTLFLLAGVLGLGIISAVLGFLFGHESLKGVTQPDMNPFVGVSAPQQQYPRQGGYLIKESEILAKVSRETKTVAKPDEPKKEAKPDTKAKPANGKPAAPPKTSLPMSVQSQGVRLDVRSMTPTSDGMELEVTMQNDSPREVQFLYDFLDISDDQSLFLSTEVKGLPTKFAAKSEKYSGVIKVFGASVSQIKWISVALADYPDQRIELKIPKIVLNASKPAT
jgi:hypothetical protein